MQAMKLKLGVAPIKRSMLSMEEAFRQKQRFMAAIRQIEPDAVELVHLDDICENGIAYRAEDISPAIEKFKDARIDALFLPFCDFGEESVAAGIATALRLPTLVWGPRDEAPNSFAQRGRDTQCGLFAATRVLRRAGVTFSYIVNSPTDSDEFQNGYHSFLRAAMVVKTVRGLRVAQIGNRPVPFMSVIANEGSLVEKLGVQCVPVPVAGIIDRARQKMEAGDAELDAYLKEFTSRVDCTPMEAAAKDPAHELHEEAQNGVRRTLAQTLAIRDAVEETGCHCASLDCWSSYDIWQGTPCIAIGELASHGIPIACEGDINGAVTLAILSACDFGRSPQFFADLTIRHPQNDNAELLWHCGPFPHALKDPASPASFRDFNGCWQLKQGELTICRLDGDADGYRLFAGEAHTTTGPETTGTYVWMETDDWPAWEEALIFGPYIHHVGGVYGRYLPVLREAARYLGIAFDTPGNPPAKAL